MAIILAKFWKEILLVALLSAFTYYVYDKVYDRGYTKAETYYKEQIADYKKQQDKKVADLEILANKLVSTNETDIALIKEDLSTLLLNARSKPTTVIVDGKCIPSKSFTSTYNESIKKANEAKASK